MPIIDSYLFFLRGGGGSRRGKRWPDRARVPIRELAEDIFDHNNGLLNDVIHLGLDQLEQYVDTTLCCLLELDRAATNSTDGTAHELDVDFSRILLKLHENLVNVPIGCQLDHDLKFLHLHIYWIIVLAEKDLNMHIRESALLATAAACDVGMLNHIFEQHTEHGHVRLGYLDLVRKDGGALLYYEIDVAQSNVPAGADLG